MKTLILINSMSGNSDKIDTDKLITKLAQGDQTDILYLNGKGDSFCLENYDKLVACGGDGTLNSVLNKYDKEKIIYYVPFGTLNEKTKDMLGNRTIKHMGKINDTCFSYVAAAGSFTEIGYTAKSKNKKKFKVFAYLFKVLRSYKIFKIDAKIKTENFSDNGTYTLLMIIDNKRCFGFPFNRMFRNGQECFQILAVKCPPHKGLLGKIELFFPMFRAFFIGFNKPHNTKYIRFCSAKNIELCLSDCADFCLDGELFPIEGKIIITKKELEQPIIVIDKRSLYR